MQTEILFITQTKFITWIPCVVLKQQSDRYWIEYVDPLSFLKQTVIVSESLIREFSPQCF